ELKKQRCDCVCLGARRILRESEEKTIYVYTFAMGFERANCSVPKEKLKSKYPDYEITWAGEGY
ncbi:14 kDa phosphohistidine phosphatase, partial [Pterocles gutturalis]